MTTIGELLRQGRNEELWQMCCGFLDLSLEQFMSIQSSLLMEQIQLLRNCTLGKKIMGTAIPMTLDEFRNQVPLTTYADYCPELLEKREDILPTKPACWVRTSGRSGEYPCKWVPWSTRQMEELELVLCAGVILASCEMKGDIAFNDKLKIFYAIAPPPYTFGVLTRIISDSLHFQFLPPLEESEGMSFEERLQKGFLLALSEGMDAFYGLPGVLVSIGRQFKSGSSSMKLSSLLSQPKALFRLGRGLVKSKIAHRQMIPKDLWSLKFIGAAGTDGVVYRREIEEMWGRFALNVYGGTEVLAVATQTWDYDSMTFFPTMSLLEFIPEEEYITWYRNNSYQPKTILLDEVKAGENYEIVVTNFHGGAMVRYRAGDMIRITARRNDRLNIDIPQMVFERRADDLIDISGFTRLTEKTIWQAIENSHVPYVDWTARKEAMESKSVLRIYLEVKPGYAGTKDEIASAVYQQLRELDQDCADLETILGVNPVEITVLPEGVFKAYTEQRRAEGADLAHLKVRHVNPSDKTLALLGVDL